MDIFEIKVKLLLDIVENKNKMLEIIYNISENQETILKSNYSSDDSKDFFNQLSEEKQKCISKVVDGDRVFQKIFLELDDVFEAKANNYKDIIKNLQNKIKTATELDIKIRAMEQKNRDILQERYNKNQTLPSEVTKRSILNKYKQNNKK